MLSEAPAKPSAKPTAAPTFASSVLLAQWGANERDAKSLLVDPATGRELPGYAPIFAWPEMVSADGTKLAATEFRGQVSEPYAGGTSDRPSAEVLHLVNLPATAYVFQEDQPSAWVDCRVTAGPECLPEVLEAAERLLKASTRP